MDPDLERVIFRALADARAAGGDYLGETQAAVQAVLRARPAATDGLRSNHKGIGECTSIPILSSTSGASLLAPVASGAGIRVLSDDVPLPGFPARLGLHHAYS
jgi:hypothetical protein